MSQEKKEEAKKREQINANLKKFDKFLVKHGNGIPQIPNHILSRINPKGEVIIISFHDDENFIILNGMYAKIWNLIDGKNTWKKIFNSLTHDSQPTLIYKSISAILNNKDFSTISLRPELEVVKLNLEQAKQHQDSWWSVYGGQDGGAWGGNLDGYSD